MKTSSSGASPLMNDSFYIRHRSQNPQPEITQPEMSEPNELEMAVEQTQAASAVSLYSKGNDSSLIDEIREEIKNGDGSNFFFDSEHEMFPESFSEDYRDFLLSYE